MNLPEKGYKRNLVLSSYAILISLFAYLLFRYLLSPLLPFIFAYVSALFLRPTIDRISKRTGISKRIVSFFTVCFVFLLIFLVLGIFFGRMITELKEILSSVMNGTADMVEGIFSRTNDLSDKIPFISRLENKEASEKMKTALSSMLSGALSSLSAKIPDAVMSFASALPSFILFAITLIVATFYMGSGIGSLNAFIIGLIPKDSRHRVFSAKEKLMKACGKYVKAYAMILFITFIQLLIGFWCLKIPYALTLSALIAIIDILPVLGVGTVLVPWAVILLIMGNTYLGIGLLIVFAIIWVVRQVSEPKIVGQSIGISPLTTLIAMYAGFKLVGFSGLFLFPIAAIIVKTLWEAGLFGENDINKKRL